MPNSNSNPLSKQHAEFRRKGWSYRTAAGRLGVNHCHLYRVLIGERQSNRLLAAIEALPARPHTPARKTLAPSLPRKPRKS